MTYHPPTGGLRLGGGGFFMPMRKYSPESLRFQPILWCKGCSRRIAPSTGQFSTQLPQNQHSSGYKMIGGLPTSGFGINRSVWQAFTHELHPVQSSALNFTGRKGVTILAESKSSTTGNRLLVIVINRSGSGSFLGRWRH